MYLMHLTICTVSAWSGKNIKNSVKIDTGDLEIYSRSMKVAWMDKAQWVIPTCKVLSFITFMMSKKITKFLPRQTITRPFFMWVKKKQNHGTGDIWAKICLFWTWPEVFTSTDENQNGMGVGVEMGVRGITNDILVLTIAILSDLGNSHTEWFGQRFE